eukprot:3898309-Amphidinium_carterae.1
MISDSCCQRLVDRRFPLPVPMVGLAVLFLEEWSLVKALGGNIAPAPAAVPPDAPQLRFNVLDERACRIQ